MSTPCPVMDARHISAQINTHIAMVYPSIHPIVAKYAATEKPAHTPCNIFVFYRKRNGNYCKQKKQVPPFCTHMCKERNKSCESF